MWEFLISAHVPNPRAGGGTQTKLAQHTSFCEEAGRILGRTQGPEAIDRLIAMLTPLDNPLRIGAIAALQSMGPRCVPRMIELLSHDDGAVAMSANVALGRGAATPSATEPLLSVLDTVDEQTLLMAIFALSEHRAVDAKPKLIGLATDDRKSVVVRVMSADAAFNIPLTPDEEKQLLAELPTYARCLEGANNRVALRFLGRLMKLGPKTKPVLPSLNAFLAVCEKSPYEKDPETWNLITQVETAKHIIETDARNQ